MKFKNRVLSVFTASALLITGTCVSVETNNMQVSATESVEDSYDWGNVEIGGGGFVSGIVTGQSEMYARTDVGGAYRYDYEKEEWVQLLDFLNEADRGLLSVDAIAIDPNDDMTVYFLCGCAYFSDARTVVFKTTDGGETFTQSDVTDMIQVHGNGYGRQCGESIAVDPDNPDIIYCGGDVTAGDSALIKSTDGGQTWSCVKSYDDIGFFDCTVKWPTWTDHQVRAVCDAEYGSQNGVSTIMIENGKVYVGTSVNDEANVYVADVDKDEFTVLSSDLPTNSYISRINLDCDGNLLLSYIGGLTFNGTGGGIYRYNIDDNTVDNISPTTNSFGACVSLPDDANSLVATTCGVWSSQLYYEDAWADDKVSWGDQFYISRDGGETWTSVTPGNAKGWGQPLQADYLQCGDFDWIYCKAIHWVGAVVLDPRDSNKICLTSGNGIFNCDNIWDELPVYYFHPNGIEEVVALDMCSVPGGYDYCAIGDYDGFIIDENNQQVSQYSPNIGSTSAIAYCPSNPDVMVRYANGQNDVGNGYYSTDGGKTWTKMSSSTGGKAAITQLDDDTYRFFQSGSDDGSVKYSDDWGATWNSCSGIPTTYGSKTTYMLVDQDDPSLVYAGVTYYNSSWSYSKSAAELSDAYYAIAVSTDYGKTFTYKQVCMYDQCDTAARLADLGNGDLIMGAGYYGAYLISDKGQTVTKLDSVNYCKTIGYGKAAEDSDYNTLYMYGKPNSDDLEGIYRSTDAGKTWVLINSDHLYGGTGNGNFLVGDMNEYGKVYMSTVGCGIVVGECTDSSATPTPKTTTTTAATTTITTTTTAKTTSTTAATTTTAVVTTTAKATTTTTKAATTTTKAQETTSGTSVTFDDSILYGDTNLDGEVNMSDVVVLNKIVSGVIATPSAQQQKNADVDVSDSIDGTDAKILLQFNVHIVDSLPYVG